VVAIGKKHDFAAMEALQEAQGALGSLSPVFIHSYKENRLRSLGRLAAECLGTRPNSRFDASLRAREGRAR
jgi:hypothetical protein